MKRQTLKDFYRLKFSSKNVRNNDSEYTESMPSISISHQDSSEIYYSPIQKLAINNVSSKHILETKYSPFTFEQKQVRRSPAQNILNKATERRTLNEIDECIEGDCDNKTHIRIMVCEDHTGIREAIVKLILKVAEEKNISIDVKESINGLECLHIIYQAFISRIHYDAVLIDEAMPFMKGSKCISLLRDMYREGCLNKMKKISISSFCDEDTINYLKSQGCDDFLPKPHTKEIISKFISSLVI